MAIVQNPITGRTRKKFGTAVFSKQFDQNTMRTKPISVRNPRTEGQVKQRTKFATVVDLVRQALPEINSAYSGTLKKMSPFNKITSINVKNAFTGEPPVLDHTKVVLCDLEGSSVSNVTLTGLEEQLMDIRWEANTTNPDELASKLTFILFNCTTNDAFIVKEHIARSVGRVEIKVPATWVDAMTALHVVATDFTQLLANKPKQTIQFKAGADLASKVK